MKRYYQAQTNSRKYIGFVGLHLARQSYRHELVETQYTYKCQIQPN